MKLPINHRAGSFATNENASQEVIIPAESGWKSVGYWWDAKTQTSSHACEDIVAWVITTGRVAGSYHYDEPEAFCLPICPLADWTPEALVTPEGKVIRYQEAEYPDLKSWLEMMDSKNAAEPS